MNRWKDWYDQGKRDYERALIDVRYGYYEWAVTNYPSVSLRAAKGGEAISRFARGLRLGRALGVALRRLSPPRNDSGQVIALC